MAGHSQFKNIMHRKEKQDAVKSRTFSKLSREISVAAMSGLPDPSLNARLRLAILNARGENMPKEIIERAIKKASATGDECYEEVCYEAYGPGGVAFIVEALTENRNRTSGFVKSSLTKFGCSLGEVGSVSYAFDRIGEITYPVEIGSVDAVFEAAITSGADDVISDDLHHAVICQFEEIGDVSKILEAILGSAKSVRVVWRAQTEVSVDEDKAKVLEKLIGVLESNDDIKAIYTNAAHEF